MEFSTKLLKLAHATRTTQVMIARKRWREWSKHVCGFVRFPSLLSPLCSSLLSSIFFLNLIWTSFVFLTCQLVEVFSLFVWFCSLCIPYSSFNFVSFRFRFNWSHYLFLYAASSSSSGKHPLSKDINQDFNYFTIIFTFAICSLVALVAGVRSTSSFIFFINVTITIAYYCYFHCFQSGHPSLMFVLCLCLHRVLLYTCDANKHTHSNSKNNRSYRRWQVSNFTVLSAHVPPQLYHIISCNFSPSDIFAITPLLVPVSPLFMLAHFFLLHSLICAVDLEKPEL